ncbi:PP-loop domain-containing protein, partial [Cardiosporidium cionae]
ILLAKKKFLCNATPSSPGGGVVFFVSQTSHSYIQNTEEREESGTPNILGSIRCGLVYRLLSMISMENIQQKECWMAQYLKERWKQHPRIHLLGPHTARSTPTLSLLLLYGNSPLSGAQDGLYLHHFFVVALLNDLFGIQTRGGCACAGPYIQHLLTLEEPILSTFETCLWSTGQEVLRPGVVRISLHFTLSIEDIHRIGEAIDWIASYGWMLLPAYTFIPETGEWLHRSEQSGSRFRLWLSDFPLFNGGNPANPSFLASEGESSPSFSFQSRVPPLSRMTSPPPPLSIPTSPPPPPLSIITSPPPPLSIPTSPPPPPLSIPTSPPPPPLSIPTSPPPPLSIPTSPPPPPPLSIPTSPPPPPLSIPTSPSPPSSIPTSISALLAAATRCVRQTCAEAAPSGVGTSSLPSSYHSLLWFALPEDARETLRLSPPTLMFPDSRGAICNGRKKERGAFSPLSEGKTEATITFEGTPHLCQCLGKESSLLPVCSYKNNSPQEIRVETACFHVRLYAPLTRENSSSCLSSSSLREEEEDRKVENDGSGRETSRKLSSSSLASATPASTPFVSFSQLSVGMEIQPVENKAKLLFLTIPQNLRRTVGAAIREFKMLQEGDRILLGLSGGKDSLTLLHILRDLQKRAPISFELSVCTVDPQTPEYNPRPLIPYLKALGIPYHFLSHPLISIAKKHMKNDSLCSFCSRIKRGILYNCMRENGYNVLVLGQHLDDICESFIMSAFQNGILNTMKANYTIKEGDLRVCRPLIFTRERALQKFARTNNLPVIQENCPACFASPKERLKAKILLSAQEFENPYLFQNLLKSLRPLMALPHAQNFEQHLSHILATSSEISDTVQVDSPQ